MIYGIIHSPTYQVPVLYLSLEWSKGGKPPSLQEVFEPLVSPSYQAQIQNVGVMGGLSMTDHPISGLPTYFVHPCRTSEAISAFTGSKNIMPTDYLVKWIGLVGGSVGLNVPIALAQRLFVEDKK